MGPMWRLFFLNSLDIVSILCKGGCVSTYPGRHSIWVMDGAAIHCHPDISTYLRLLGIVPIFLPPYCPFFNPIELVFSIAKSRLQRIYKENLYTAKDLPQVVATVMSSLQNFDMSDLFSKCGYAIPSQFNPNVAFSVDLSALGFS